MRFNKLGRSDPDPDPVSLCQGMAKVERRMREEDGFREKLMELEKNLVKGRKRKIKK